MDARMRKGNDAAMGIRTPVAGVRGPHDWPDYTIAAGALHIRNSCT